MNKRFRRISLTGAFILAMCHPTFLMGQGRFHFDVDYLYHLGLSEKYEDGTLRRSDCNMGGNAILFAGRYSFTDKLSVGAGFGLDRYTNPDYNTFPVYATLRYSPIKSALGAYIFTDLGYSFASGEAGISSPTKLLNWADFHSGVLCNAGIGYSKKMGKNFRMNFRIAYTCKKLRDAYIRTEPYDYDYTDTSKEFSDNLRHSLSFGVGISFF